MGHMNEKELEEFRVILDDRRATLVGSAKKAREEEIAMDKDDLPDEIDLATSEYSQALTLRLRGREKVLLQKIDAALERLGEGSYGVCEECEGPIAPKRLRARPVTTLCIECKEAQEQTERGFR